MQFEGKLLACCSADDEEDDDDDEDEEHKRDELLIVLHMRLLSLDGISLVVLLALLMLLEIPLLVDDTDEEATVFVLVLVLLMLFITGLSLFKSSNERLADVLLWVLAVLLVVSVMKSTFFCLLFVLVGFIWIAASASGWTGEFWEPFRLALNFIFFIFILLNKLSEVFRLTVNVLMSWFFLDDE